MTAKEQVLAKWPTAKCVAGFRVGYYVYDDVTKDAAMELGWALSAKGAWSAAAANLKGGKG